MSQFMRYWQGLVEQVIHFRRNRASSQELTQLRALLWHESDPDISYLVLIVGSCLIATLGLLSNSAAVIIGAMIVAPLMMPIRGLALAVLIGDLALFRLACTAIVVGTFTAIVISSSLGLITSIPIYGSEIMARSQPNLLDLGIAVAAGAVGGYALVQPKISSTLAGVAIAVALMPPVCTIGLGLAQTNLSLARGATLLYLTNLLGIAFACMVVFWLSGYVSLKKGRRPIALGVILTGLLVIPLGISFGRLLRQNRLEANIRSALVNRTLTFQRLDLFRMETNWSTDPPTVNLDVRASEPVTPNQVELLQQFISREMGQPLRLVFRFSNVEEVTSDSPTAN
ncbi:DUF389 domain-containing protein [Thermosynechococcaceae cyanobacterium BACA0444]|uniref:DUF389 domain-containing protein n=1 Tax=Pseudocalidococcus azoricus BACA0444 TaxID=2918990 RepID=A0AAE4FRN4_9CYAN|nr:DUF389 domain-containing protein [Pseudocalidococcus azoricus]MDS3860287.1 DUF389 domain-containing protein [Pseudocalidococcus azoricus BACA0444]